MTLFELIISVLNVTSNEKFCLEMITVDFITLKITHNELILAFA